MQKNILPVALLIGLTACLNGKSNDTADTGDADTNDTNDTNDTQPPEEEVLPVIPVQGGVIVKHYPPDIQYPEETGGNGIFIDASIDGYGDIALCIINGWCSSSFPTYNELTAIESSDIDLQVNQPREIGSVTVLGGSLTTDYYYENANLHYYNATADLGYVGGDAVLEIGAGDYFPSGASMTVTGPDTMVLTSPDPMSALSGNGFGGANLLGELTWDLAWAPGSDDSQIYINVLVTDSSETTNTYMVTPEDTGSYSLDINGLVTDPASQFRIIIGRYSGTSSVVDDQSVSFHVSSEQWLYGAVTDAELVDNPAPYTDTCDEGAFSEALSTGVYAYGGTLSSSLADDLSITCTEWGSLGQDGFIEVILQDGETITADYRSSGDAVLYLLDACGASECLAVADDTLDGELESMSYTNSSGAEMTAYLGVDIWLSEGTPFEDNDYILDVVIE